MAASYDFIALPEDFALVEAWLYDHGAVRYGIQPADGKIVMHFPEFGPISFWPEKPDFDRYESGSAEWKAAVISRIEHVENPLTARVNDLESPVAALLPPVSDPRGFWRSADLWFPTPALRKRFPGLAAINNQLERWFRAHPTIFDRRRREPIDQFPRTLGGFDGFITRVYALPAAYRLITSGGSFMHRLASAKGSMNS